MVEQNGRIKVPPALAWTIVVSGMLAGVGYGTLMAGQADIAQDIGTLRTDVVNLKVLIQERYYTAREIDNKMLSYEQRLQVLERKTK